VNVFLSKGNVNVTSRTLLFEQAGEIFYMTLYNDMLCNAMLCYSATVT